MAERDTRRPHTMLFNSPEFVLGFLPLALAGFFLAGRIGGTTSGHCAGWSPPACSSTAGGTRNSCCCWPARSSPITRCGQRILILTRGTGIAAALADRRHRRQPGAARLVQIRQLHAATACSGCTRPELDIFLPLAISFFTFQQIMFLVESHRRRPRRCRPAALCRVRRVLSAPDRRSDRAAARDHAAAAGAPTLPCRAPSTSPKG